MPDIEERQAKIEGVLEQMDKRISSVEERLGKVEAEIKEIRQEMHTNFRWLVGIIIATWITTILAILFKT